MNAKAQAGIAKIREVSGQREHTSLASVLVHTRLVFAVSPFARTQTHPQSVVKSVCVSKGFMKYGIKRGHRPFAGALRVKPQLKSRPMAQMKCMLSYESNHAIKGRAA